MFTDMIQSIVDRILQAPDRIALLNDEATCTFGTLGARCQGMIDCLRAAPQGAAMIYGHKEVDAVAAMLACALVRRPFVFVDVGNPLRRLGQIAQTARAAVTLCSRSLPGHVDGLVVDCRSLASRTLTITRAEKGGGKIFYIAFTSGSTGTPKGVPISHDNFSCFFGWYGALLQGCRGTGAHVNHASLSFDMGMVDLWPSLAVGKAVILLSHRYNALPRANLRTLLRSPEVIPGSWFSTPTFLALMSTELSFRESTLPKLRSFFIGGEPVPRPLLTELTKRFPSAEIWHGYGPTEVTCMSHCRRLTTSDLMGSGPLPLGRVSPPNEIRIIHEDGHEMAAGEPGEVELSGPQVAQGYLPPTHPQNACFRKSYGKRCYRTGDYGVIDREGNLLLSGRMDGQVKWNGNRIEIAEIERAAQDVVGVRHAVAIPLMRNERVVDLVLFVRIHDDGDSAQSAFLGHLRETLPAYMTPRSIRFVDSLPVTLHGKVDRLRLLHSLEDSLLAEASSRPSEETAIVVT
jgi:D-alanine--poly(phosphoribitol) ligase subunit 1